MRNQKLKLSGIALAGIIVLVSFVYAINIQPVVIGDPDWIETFSGLKNFESYKELSDFLRTGSGYHYSYYPWRSFEFERLGISSVDATNSGGKVVDYSNTNVQVAGIDEPDIVKTDGKYLYIVSGNRVIIVKATPAEEQVSLTMPKFEYESEFSLKRTGRDGHAAFSADVYSRV